MKTAALWPLVLGVMQLCSWSHGFVAPGRLVARSGDQSRLPPLKARKMKKGKGSKGGKGPPPSKNKSLKGFGEKDVVPLDEQFKTTLDMKIEANEIDTLKTAQTDLMDVQKSTSISGSVSSSQEDGDGDVNSIFRKYGMTAESNAELKVAADAKRKREEAKQVPIDERPFGQEIMAGLDAKQQESIDKTLVTLAFGSLAFCIASGLGIATTAIKVVFPDFQLNSNLDALISNVLDPAFTPALGVFFLFSISYGLWKFAQISSTATVYRE